MVDGAGGLISGRYRLIEPIGRGGMGTVWRGHDEILDREVAVKEILLPRELSDNERDSLNKRAMREARSAARLNHRGVVTVHDVALHNDCPVIVMEFVRGRSLAEIIHDDGPLPPWRVAEIGADILDALREAHAAGVIHRDLKPANVLITDRRVVLTDFGIASLAGDATITKSGVLMGTPAFMAPEQAHRRPATPASDLWAFGATMYAAVEGHPPFTGDFIAVLSALLTESPPQPERAGPLTPILGALLKKEPVRRATAEQAAVALATIIGRFRSPDRAQPHIPHTSAARTRLPAGQSATVHPYSGEQHPAPPPTRSLPVGADARRPMPEGQPRRSEHLGPIIFCLVTFLALFIVIYASV
jgi:serine/threonine protein kinase